MVIAVLQLDMMVLVFFYYFATQYRVDIPQFFSFIKFTLSFVRAGKFSQTLPRKSDQN